MLIYPMAAPLFLNNAFVSDFSLIFPHFRSFDIHLSHSLSLDILLHLISIFHIKSSSTTSHQQIYLKMRLAVLLTLAAVSFAVVSCVPVTRTTSPAPDAPSPIPSVKTTVDVETPCVSEVSASLELEENVDQCSICLETPSDPKVRVNSLISTDNFMQTYILQSLY
jgi:hypothetical protein